MFKLKSLWLGTCINAIIYEFIISSITHFLHVPLTVEDDSYYIEIELEPKCFLIKDEISRQICSLPKDEISRLKCFITKDKISRLKCFLTKDEISRQICSLTKDEISRLKCFLT